MKLRLLKDHGARKKGEVIYLDHDCAMFFLHSKTAERVEEKAVLKAPENKAINPDTDKK